MSESFNHSYSFTSIAWNRMYETVDHEYFLEKDTDLIFDALNQMLKPISFGAYLQRYIYRKCGMTNSFSDVPIKDYQTIIFPRKWDPRIFYSNYCQTQRFGKKLAYTTNCKKARRTAFRIWTKNECRRCQ